VNDTDDNIVWWVNDSDRDALLPPRPDGVPDDAVPATLWFGPDENGACKRYAPNGASEFVSTDLWRDRGVPVSPYQPTPPEPEPAETLAECMKAITEAERRAWNQSACGPIAAPVSEVRTGPLGLSEDTTRQIARDWVKSHANDVQAWVRNATIKLCGEFVARWDAEDAAPAETLADTITVELPVDVADRWLEDDDTEDDVAIMASAIHAALRAAAGLSVPSEGGEQ